MNEPSYNPDTVGTARTQDDPEKSSESPLEVSYGQAIEHLRNGGAVQREGWAEKGLFVFRQVPSKVPLEVVPKMSSLPDKVKSLLQQNRIAPSYANQMALVKPDGEVNSWVASSSDTFALDWVLL